MGAGNKNNFWVILLTFKLKTSHMFCQFFCTFSEVLVVETSKCINWLILMISDTYGPGVLDHCTAIMLFSLSQGFMDKILIIDHIIH